MPRRSQPQNVHNYSRNEYSGMPSAALVSERRDFGPLIDLGEITTASPFQSPSHPQSPTSYISPSSEYTTYNHFAGSPRAAADTPLTPFDSAKPFSPVATQSTQNPYFHKQLPENAHVPTPVSPAPRYRPPTRTAVRSDNLRQKSLPVLNTVVDDQAIPIVPLERRLNDPFSPVRRRHVRSFTSPPQEKAAEGVGRGEPIKLWVNTELESAISPKKWKNFFRWGRISPKTPSPDSRVNHWLDNTHDPSTKEMPGSPSSPPTDRPFDVPGGRIQGDQ